MRDVAIVGAGPAGMAVAKCLKDQGINPLILEMEGDFGSSWRRHYERLHIHTARARSHLPGKPIPRSYPQYVPRAQFVEYLDEYAAEFALDAEFGCKVEQIERHDGGWRLRHSKGNAQARHVVLATGFAQQPKFGDWPGLDSFPGKILHTRWYRRAADLPGQRVLVIGFGNSGGEIAVDLIEQGREVEIAVRNKVNLLPKELFGIPIGNFELMQKLFGVRLADRLNAPILRAVLGDYEQYGLRKADVGPLTDIVKNGRVPLIDIGTLPLMRAGKLRARPGVARVEGARVHFADGSSGDYDAILMATGYTVDLRPLLGDLPEALDATGRPHKSGAEIAPGLWAISYHAVTNGQLRAIAAQAPHIAKGIAEA